MKLPLLVASIAFISGCASPQFSVTEADTRFSENKNYFFTSENNRISTKSVAGGLHIDNYGVFLNPFVEKSRTDGSLVLLGLNVINKTEVSSASGSVNRLGLIREIACLPSDGKLITLNVSNPRDTSSGAITYNTVARSASFTSWETGVAKISKESFARLAESDRLSCKITGSSRSVVYEEKDVSPDFLANLRQFYNEYVKQ